MHGQQTQLLVLCLLLKLLVVLEETFGCGDDLSLVDAPEILEIVDDRSLLVQGFQHSLVGHEVQSQNAVADSGRLEDLDPPNFTRVVAVSSAAGLDIDSLDIDDPDGISRDNSTLVEVETVLGLGLLLAFEVFADGMSFQHNPIGFIFDLQFDFLGKGGVVGDIEMSIVFGLFGSVLPDVRTQDSPGRSVYDMGASVESPKCVPPVLIDTAKHLAADQGHIHNFSYIMQEAMTHLGHVTYLEALVSNLDAAEIMDLPSRGRVEGTAIKDDDVGALLLLLHVGQNSHYLGIELSQSVVLVVKVVSCWVLHGLVQNQLSCLCHFLVTFSDLVVESVRDGQFADLRNGVSRNAPTLDNRDPLVQVQLSLALAEQLL